MAKKYVCVAERCKWRVECGPKNAMCSKLNCPHIRILEETLPAVKWGNLAKNKK